MVLLAKNAGSEARNVKRQASEVHVDQATRLKGLIDFARLEDVSIGIESLSESTDAIDPIDRGSLSVLAAVKGIAGQSNVVRTVGSVVLIRSRQGRSPRWLAQRLSAFHLSPVTLGMANASLYMRVKKMLDPAIGGFAGSIPGDSNDLIGPLDFQQETVRSALCRLAATVPGTVWTPEYVGKACSTSWTNELWTLCPGRR